MKLQFIGSGDAFGSGGKLNTCFHVDVYDENTTPPIGSIPADHVELSHNNTYGPLPLFYVDKIIVCRDCGKEEL